MDKGQMIQWKYRLNILLRKYLNSIKIVQFAPQVIIDTSYVKWRDNESDNN
jgi:hypothetical protein